MTERHSHPISTAEGFPYIDFFICFSYRLKVVKYYLKFQYITYFVPKKRQTKIEKILSPVNKNLWDPCRTWCFFFSCRLQRGVHLDQPAGGGGGAGRLSIPLKTSCALFDSLVPPCRRLSCYDPSSGQQLLWPSLPHAKVFMQWGEGSSLFIFSQTLKKKRMKRKSCREIFGLQTEPHNKNGVNRIKTIWRHKP